MCPYGDTDLCLYSLQPDTNLHCEINTGLVYGAAYLFTPQLSLVLTAPTHRGMARLSLPVCLVEIHLQFLQIIHFVTSWQSLLYTTEEINNQ